MFYNTTKETFDTLETSIKKAKFQDEIILSAFQENNKMTPSECWINYFKTEEVPITSIRRSINTLTLNEKLIKTDEKKIGIYGKPEYFWQLKASQLTLF